MNGKNLALGVAVLLTTTALSGQHAEASICETDDISLTIGATTWYASSCTDGITQGGGPSVESDAINTGLGTSLTFIAKSDNATPDTGSLGGIQFTVDTDPGSSGGWTLSWSDINGSALANLPVQIDLAIGIFGGNNGAAYLFDDLVLPAVPGSGTGTFAITFTNNGGNNPAISHFNLLGGNLSTITREVPVPEPTTLALLGSALLGLWYVRRRQYSGS